MITEPEGAHQRPGLPRRFWMRAISTGLGVVVFAAALTIFAWWDTHPNLIPPVGDGVGAVLAVGQADTEDSGVATVRGHDSGFETDLPDGTSTFTDTGNLRSFTVTIERITPNVVENTSGATIRMKLCTRNAAHVWTRKDGTKEYDEYCPSYEPVGHQKVKISMAPGSSSLAVTVTPHHAGVVRIIGFRISYREGIRRQTQTGGMTMVFRTR